MVFFQLAGIPVVNMHLLKTIHVYVSGYLRTEKCKGAFKEFLKGSPHLGPIADTIFRKNYFITRVGGLSLIDYLNEYAIIYTISK